MLIVALTIGVYAPSVGNGFAMDDAAAAAAVDADGVPRPFVGTLQPLGDYFNANYHAGTGHQTALYRPVTILSYAAVNALRRGAVDPRLEAVPHHAVNVLLHALATLLVFALVAGLRVSGGAALAAAAVFGLHAIHSEVVAGVVGRAELLGFTGGALACLVLARAARAGRAAAVAWSGLGAIAAFMAFGAKENALAWAAVAPVYVACVHRRALAGVRSAAVLAVPAVIYLYLRARMIAALPDGPLPIEYVANPLWHADALQRCCGAVALWAYGLLKVLLPVALYADYGPAATALPSSVADARAVGAAVLLLLTVVGAAWAARRHPLLCLAAVVFFGFSAVISNVPFAIGTLFGERLYYSPSLGAALLAAGVWQAWRWRRGVLVLLLGAWLGWNAQLIWARNPVWANDAALFLHEAEHNPDCVRVLVCAAGVHIERGDLALAEGCLRRATEIEPNYAVAQNSLAFVLLNRGDLTGAEIALDAAAAARYRSPGVDVLIAHNHAALQRARGAAATPR